MATVADKKVLTGEDEDGEQRRKPDSDEQIVVVEDKPAPKAEAEHDDEDDDEQEERRIKRSEEDDAQGNETAEQRRERNRQKKLERKQKREEAARRTGIEMAFLRKRNEDLERRFSQLEVQSFKRTFEDIDSQIAKAEQEYRLANQVMERALAANNSKDAVQALAYRDEAKAKHAQLLASKQQHGQQIQAELQQRKQQPQIDPAVATHAQAFLAENDWYDPDGGDEDSAIMLAIDNALVRDGFDPRTPMYWKELRKRAAKRLPERFAAEPQRQNGHDPDDDGDDDDDTPPLRKPRGGPAVGSGRQDGLTQHGQQQFYLSPERKQAMIEAGMWDDEGLRKKQIKRYMEYDKAARQRR